MNEETRKVLIRLERLAEKESLRSIGPVKGKIIAGSLKLEHYMDATLMSIILPKEDVGKVTTIETELKDGAIS